MTDNNRHRTIMAALSFVRIDNNEAVNYWSPVRTNAWDVDCAAGRKAAIALTQYIHSSSDLRILPSVLAAIAAADKLEEGVEVGFFTAFGELLVRGLYG